MTDNKPWSYWDIYDLPIPIRKWFVRKVVEKIEKANKNTPSNPEPLTQAQKQKMIAESEIANNVRRVMPAPFVAPRK